MTQAWTTMDEEKPPTVDPEEGGDEPVDGEVVDLERATTKASEVTPTRVRWLWRGRLALGKAFVLEGDPDLGKSTITLDIIARLTTSRSMPFGNPTGEVVVPGGKALILTAEDDPGDTVVPRLRAAGADLERVRIVKDDEVFLTFPDNLDVLEKYISEWSASLVIIDPVVAYLDEQVNVNRDQSVRRYFLRPLSVIARRTDSCIVGLRHWNKAGGSKVLYRGGGSIGVVGGVRAGLFCAKDPDNEGINLLAVNKSNLAHPRDKRPIAYRLVEWEEDPDYARVEWLGLTNHATEDLGAEPERLNPEERSALADAVGFLQTVLGDGPVAAANVMQQARAVGISEKTLRRAKASCGVRSVRTAMDGHWLWSLSVTSEGQDGPEDGQDAEGGHAQEGDHVRGFGHLRRDGAPEGNGECSTEEAVDEAGLTFEELLEDATTDAPTEHCRMCGATTDLDSSGDHCADLEACVERFSERMTP